AQAPAVSGADCWAATLTFPDVNSEFGLSMIEFDDGEAGDGIDESGAGDCALDTRVDPTADGDDCQLDKIYVTTTVSGEGPGPGPTPSPGPPQACRGTDGSDILVGTAGDDLCLGLGGSDRIRTLKGDDVANGGKGSDALRLGSGDDTGRGGAGGDLVACGPGSDTGIGGAGDDTVRRNCEERRSV
ncbi:MAG: calcium-binding protein, partial [Actinomycetota bacterium]